MKFDADARQQLQALTRTIDLIYIQDKIHHEYAASSMKRRKASRDTIDATSASGYHAPADVPSYVADKRTHHGPSTREHRGLRTRKKKKTTRNAREKCAVSALTNRV